MWHGRPAREPSPAQSLTKTDTIAIERLTWQTVASQR